MRSLFVISGGIVPAVKPLRSKSGCAPSTRLPLPAVAAALGVIVLGCGTSVDPGASRREEPTTESVDRAPAVRPAPLPDILLFTIDTARADHFSAHGYERETSPTVRELAERGTRFDRAYAPSSWTLPSVVSMLTGVLPREHGVTHATLESNGSQTHIPLSDELPSMVETLRAAGYETVGVTANVFLHGGLGFDRGFDDYECLGFVALPQLRQALEPRVERLAASSRPFFLWVHVLEPHFPYVEQEPALAEFWPPPRPRLPERVGPYTVRDMLQFIREDATGDHLEFIEALYDSEIRATDDFLRELLGRLEARRLAVVVSSDHGEEFFEHGGVGHGRTLYEESIRVPLVIALPEEEPRARVVRRPVSLMDVLPTLVELVGARVPEGVSGYSLLSSLRGRPLRRPRVIAELDASMSLLGDVAPLRSATIIGPRYKYIERTRGPSGAALYDLSRDPAETYDRSALQAEIASSMRRELRGHLGEAFARQPLLRGIAVPVPIEHLRALGYAE